MASGMNPFDLLDGGAEDVTALLSSQLEKTERKQKQKKRASSASKTQPSFQEVRRFEDGGSGGGRGYGRGGYNKGPASSSGSFNNERGAGGAFEGDAAKQYERRKHEGSFHGGHHRGFSNGDGADRAERPPRKVSEQSFRLTKEAYPETEKLGAQNTVTEDAVSNSSKNNAVNNLVEEKPEHKEMTLEEYQKVLEERKKALRALKVAERKVDTKEFQSMQLLSNKRTNDAVVSKLHVKEKEIEELDCHWIFQGSDKDKKKKSISINEFLRPAGGGAYRGRGRGRGRGAEERLNRPQVKGHLRNNNAVTPHIEDPDQFPILAKK